MCGFNKMVPQHTLQTSQWPLFGTCFPGTSFPVSETCRDPFALPIFQRVIFFFGGIWNRVFTLTNPVRWMIWRIDRSLFVGPCHGRFKKKGLKTASKKTVVILPILFLKLNHAVWRVLNVNLLEKQLSTVYFKSVVFPWVILYIFWGWTYRTLVSAYNSIVSLLSFPWSWHMSCTVWRKLIRLEKLRFCWRFSTSIASKTENNGDIWETPF